MLHKTTNESKMKITLMTLKILTHETLSIATAWLLQAMWKPGSKSQGNRRIGQQIIQEEFNMKWNLQWHDKKERMKQWFKYLPIMHVMLHRDNI